MKERALKRMALRGRTTLDIAAFAFFISLSAFARSSAQRSLSAGSKRDSRSVRGRL
jgi:hypothetical protein